MDKWLIGEIINNQMVCRLKQFLWVIQAMNSHSQLSMSSESGTNKVRMICYQLHTEEKTNKPGSVRPYSHDFIKLS